MNAEDMLKILGDIEDGAIVKVCERCTGESAEGEVSSVYQWVVDMAAEFGGLEFYLA